jgi:hypothetical protein
VEKASQDEGDGQALARRGDVALGRGRGVLRDLSLRVRSLLPGLHHAWRRLSARVGRLQPRFSHALLDEGGVPFFRVVCSLSNPHLHGFIKWLESLQSMRQHCPMCRQDWKFRN